RCSQPVLRDLVLARRPSTRPVRLLTMVHQQAAAFVLDALDPSEAYAFERHLEQCPDCEDELESLRLAATALAFAGELPEPRPQLRRRVVEVGGVVLPFRRRWSMPLVAAAAVAAACAAIAVGVHDWTESAPTAMAGVHAYGLKDPSSGLALRDGGM